VLRVRCDPPVDQYGGYGVTLLDEGLDVDQFLRSNRIAF
jgi:hypothetical protein